MIPESGIITGVAYLSPRVDTESPTLTLETILLPGQKQLVDDDYSAFKTYTPVIAGPLLEGDASVAGYYPADNLLQTQSRATGDGSINVFVHDSDFPVLPGSLDVEVADLGDTYNDDGNGNIVLGVTIVGTINYSNGSFWLTTPLGHTPVSGSSIIATVTHAPKVAVLLDGIKLGEFFVDTSASTVSGIVYDDGSTHDSWAWHFDLPDVLVRRQRVSARARVAKYAWSDLTEQIAVTQYFRQNLINYVPPEFTYLDEQTGFNDLANFIQILAVTMDELKDYIDSFVEIFDIDRCDEQYIPHIAAILGYQLNKTDSVESQRRQLKNAVAWYKVKGTFESFKILFYALGYTISLWELWTEDYLTFYQVLPGYPANTVADDVPPTEPLLIENGGTWYRSPHFAIKFEALGVPNLTAEGLRYILSRISQLRPAHTVLEYLEYVLKMEETYEIQNEEFHNTAIFKFVDDGWLAGYCTPGDPVYVRSGELFPAYPVFPTRNGPDAVAINMKRDQTPTVCNPPEDLEVHGVPTMSETYYIPLYRDGMGIIPAAPAPVALNLIDQTTFPYRGMTEEIFRDGQYRYLNTLVLTVYGGPIIGEAILTGEEMEGGTGTITGEAILTKHENSAEVGLITGEAVLTLVVTDETGEIIGEANLSSTEVAAESAVIVGEANLTHTES